LKTQRDRVAFEMTYLKGEAVIQASLLPDRLPYMEPGSKLLRMELRQAGSYEDGREFQLIYVEVQPPEEVPRG